MNEFTSTFCLLVAIQQGAMESYVQRMGSRVYRDRATAHKILQKHMEAPWSEFLVKGLQKSRGDPEIDRRTCQLCEKWQYWDATDCPSIYTLPEEFPNRSKIIRAAQNKVQQFFFNPFDRGEIRDKRDCCATYLFLYDLKKQSWWTSSIRKLLKKMQNDRRYIY